MNVSLAQHVAALPADERARVLDGLTDVELASWAFWSRPEQVAPPGDWLVWLILAGRGWGKTRTGGEWIADVARRVGRGGRFALVAPTLDDVRDVMVEGESGLLSIFRPEELRGGDVDRAWNRSLGELWLANGSRFKGYSAERARKLRGPQHHAAWADEASSWTDAGRGTGQDSTWSNLLLGLRLGQAPRVCVTTTPKRNALTRALATLERAHVTRGTTYENLANLAPTFRDAVLSLYEGTTLGRQELQAELLGDVEGALWTGELIAGRRCAVVERAALRRVVVAVDPNVKVGGGADECGIIVVGERPDGHAVVLADRSTTQGARGWAPRVADAVAEWNADAVVAEGNQGGELVTLTLEAAGVRVPVRTVYAHDAKGARAEPVVMHYEAGRVHHAGTFVALEDQLTGWVPGVGKSPGRLDALVWAITDLLVEGSADVLVDVF